LDRAKLTLKSWDFKIYQKNKQKKWGLADEGANTDRGTPGGHRKKKAQSVGPMVNRCWRHVMPGLPGGRKLKEKRQGLGRQSFTGLALEDCLKREGWGGSKTQS